MESISTLILIATVVIFSPMIYQKIAGESPSVPRKTLSLAVTLVIAGAFSFFYHLFQNESFIEGLKRGYDKAQYYKIAETPNSMEFGCVQKEQIETLEKLASSDNAEEFKEYFLKQVQKGNCIVFNETEEIKLIESEFLSGYVLIERKNPKKQYWTDIATLREK